VEQPRDMEIFYLGAQPTQNHARVHVRRWIPAWKAWAETQFSIEMNQDVESRDAPIRLDLGRGQERREKLSFVTGCKAVSHKPDEWLEVRNAFGVTQRLPRVTIKYPGPIAVDPSAVAQEPESAPLSTGIASAARMIGRSDRRYLNVGFRCVRPLWTPPAAE